MLLKRGWHMARTTPLCAGKSVSIQTDKADDGDEKNDIHKAKAKGRSSFGPTCATAQCSLSDVVQLDGSCGRCNSSRIKGNGMYQI